MESDLVSGVPQIRLRTEIRIFYTGPVPFQRKHLVLWLPLATETYLDFNGHRIHRRQDLSNYLLFWVDERGEHRKAKDYGSAPGILSGKLAGLFARSFQYQLRRFSPLNAAAL